MIPGGIAKIKGNQQPVIGKADMYTVSDWLPDTTEETKTLVKWELFRKRDNGEFTTTKLIKTGISVPFTFDDGAYGIQFYITAYCNDIESPNRIYLTPQKGAPVFNKLTYLDENKKPLGNNTPGVNDEIYLKLETHNMQDDELIVLIGTEPSKTQPDDTTLLEAHETVPLNGSVVQIPISLMQLKFKKYSNSNALKNMWNDMTNGASNDQYYISVIRHSVTRTTEQMVLVKQDILTAKGFSASLPKPVQKQGNTPQKQTTEDKSTTTNQPKYDNVCGTTLHLRFSCVVYHGTQDNYGPDYEGHFPIVAYNRWNTLIQEGKADENIKKIITVMAENEGNMDCVMSYDNTVVTAGAMQNTLTQGSKKETPGSGDLAKQVSEYKANYPEDYEKNFVKCGWSVEGTGNKAVMSYNGITGSALKLQICSSFTKEIHEKKLRLTSRPLETLVNAISYPTFLDQQIISFIKRLNDSLDKKPTGYESYKIKDFVQSNLGKATVLDLDINKPSHVSPDFGSALNHFFDNNPTISKNPKDWGEKASEYEKEIIDYFGIHRRMAPLKGASVAPQRYRHLKTRLQ